MVCDRCHRPITASANPDQPLCGVCCGHLRAGGGLLGSPTPETAQRRRPIDLDLLPLRAGILYGEVPLYPTAADFELAVSIVADEEHDPAAHWQIEAVRWRRTVGYGKPLDETVLAIVAGKVAARLWKLMERSQRWADQESA